jgi:S-layer protein (TIGR01567 family)
MMAAGENTPYLFDKSKNRNLMLNEQITNILIDSNTETTFSSDAPLKLADGYELAIISTNVNETKATVDLRKDGQVVDTQMVQPGLEGATMADKTYYYRKDLYDTKQIVTIAVHFKSLMHSATKDSAIVDGIFQISDTCAPIKRDQLYGKMSIRKDDPTNFTITMDNKDNQVTLGLNKVTELMAGIFIKTADQSDLGVVDNPLRYYLFRIYDCTFP